MGRRIPEVNLRTLKPQKAGGAAAPPQLYQKAETPCSKAYGAVAYWTTPKVRTAREVPRNAAHQVPPFKTQVLMRKAPGGDAY